MNREIKFRAWDIKCKTLFPVHELEFHKISNSLTKCVGYDDHDKDGWTVHGGCDNRFANGERYVLMQYTGLKDKNGREVYEGDILRIHEWRMNGEVNFASGMFKVRDWLRDNFNPSLASFMVEVRCEVIGNIYETPELLEAQP